MDASPETPALRIFLVGLSDAFARSVARYVSADERIVLCGVVPDLALAGIMLPATKAALALVDWAALGDAAGPALRSLRASCPGLWIASMVHDAAGYREQAFREGANAVLSKEGFADEIEPLLTHILASGNRVRGVRHA